MNLSDRAVSYLRTAVPVLWGSLIAILLPHVPWLPAPVVEWLSGEVAIALVSGAVILAWYWVWRRVEHLIPPWVAAILLGSSKTPTYAPVIDGAAVITSVSHLDTSKARHLEPDENPDV